MKKNNCYKCPYKGNVPGSAHSSCNHPIIVDKEIRFKIGLLSGIGEFQGFTNKETKKSILSFDSHGVKNGWCTWPLDFDPCWVNCKLPLNIEK